MEYPWPVDAIVQDETVQLLREVADYLARLPANPMTHAVMRKVEDHLQNPGVTAHKSRIKQAAKDQKWHNRLYSGAGFSGTDRFTANGLPEFEFMIVGGQAQLRSPALIHAISTCDAQEAGKISMSLCLCLSDGISIKLTPINSATEVQINGRIQK